ncbi:ABC transporter ATP-binding protein [Nocardia puris]|uniref:Iron complex transport system ATP-binding protein n=1 Tax=Nocardia puris TaxID=208602 RepID=A0A366DIK5_9NOCA|nr:ABC transporter ATP-binding protein [Nocardia puris]RBO89329.1 iron complex transport system ATP-binding protein [Nocardia puris]
MSEVQRHEPVEVLGAGVTRAHGDTSGFGRREQGGAAIVAEGLTCAVGRREVVRGAEFQIGPGEVVGIVGPNGSGKTTLVHVLAGVRRPKAGRVTVDGVAVHDVSARARARTVALVAQDERPPADLLAGEVVALGRTPYLPPWGVGGPREQHVIDAALAAVDLAGFAGRPVHKLSGGERQRVLLARALIQDTPVLMLDEPTNHLDITHRLELLSLARTLNRTVVTALHELALADRYCDRILVLHNGSALPLTPPEVALRPEIVGEVFGVRATRVRHPDTGEDHLLITPREATS